MGVLRFYRRDLPHWRIDSGGAVYFVTWRLAGGQAALSDAERDAVVAALRHWDGIRCRLLAFVVMDDHVHALVQPFRGVRLEQLLHSWKTYTAVALTREHGRRGHVWQHESYDRLVRDEKDLRALADYIAGNPWSRWPGIRVYRWVWAEGRDTPMEV